MDDAAIFSIVSGCVTISTMVVGFLTLWVKLKYGIKEASDAAKAAVDQATIVSDKLDDNTNITKAVNDKADIVVNQTNGTMEATQSLIERLAERVAKLEDYNHNSNHRMSDAIQAMHLQVAALVALQPKPVTVVTVPKEGE